MEYLKKEIKKNVWINKQYLQDFYTNYKPKWVKFCEKLLDANYVVFLSYISKNKSAYMTIVKNNKMVRLRYSDHQPKLGNYLYGKVDYYVGPEHRGMLNENEILNILKLVFGK